MNQTCCAQLAHDFVNKHTQHRKLKQHLLDQFEAYFNFDCHLPEVFTRFIMFNSVDQNADSANLRIVVIVHSQNTKQARKKKQKTRSNTKIKIVKSENKTGYILFRGNKLVIYCSNIPVIVIKTFDYTKINTLHLQSKFQYHIINYMKCNCLYYVSCP